jgi:hypothetical protein
VLGTTSTPVDKIREVSGTTQTSSPTNTWLRTLESIGPTRTTYFDNLPRLPRAPLRLASIDSAADHQVPDGRIRAITLSQSSADLNGNALP